MKRNIPLIFSLLAILAVTAHCGGKKNVSIPHSPTTPSTTPPTHLPHPTAPTFVWGGYFETKDTGRYKELLERCSRCGTTQVTSYSYKKEWFLGDHPKKCEHWLRKGYLQIEFLEKKLPTEAIVTLQPEYLTYGDSFWSGPAQRCFGHPFAVKGRAQAINKSGGFSIALTPSNGLGGTESLYISSDSAHHVSNHTLEISGQYGGESGLARRAEIFSAILEKQGRKPIAGVQFSCRQYPHHPITTCVNH